MTRVAWTKILRPLGIAAGAVLLLAGCGAAVSNHRTATGGVVTFAEGPSAPPNYIFPMEPSADFSVTNLSQFSYLMYPPLYWFGNGGQPTFNPALSIANAPTLSAGDTVVNITLKHWQWSNGQPLTSRDVIFWLNLLSAATDPNSPTIGSQSAPGPGWGAEVAGGFPFNLVSYAATGTYSLQLHLNAAYNPTWFLYNELSQMTPMPQAAWDELSSSGPVGNYDASAEARMPLPGTSPAQYVPQSPGTESGGALGVAQFLNSQSQELGTYSSNPLWQVVDGPFRLAAFTTAGYAKMVPNRDYSGSPKPTISAFVEEPFTSDTAEFDALASGSLTMGFIPNQDLSQKTTLERRFSYSFAPWYSFGFTYFPYNFTNPTVGPIFRQLYFRQAFQSLVNQTQYIKDFYLGYATVTDGPVPTYPVHNPDESQLEAGTPPYPYNPTRAVSLLRDHGWTVVPGGTSSCSRPGNGPSDCGPGISSGEKLQFSLLYQNGVVVLTNQMEALQSAARSVAGIDLTLSSAPFSQVLATAFNGCTMASPCSGWELANWGGGWTYAPDYLPTGGELFGCGSTSNAGDWCNATTTANITATHIASSQTAEIAALYRYEDQLAMELPVVYTPSVPIDNELVMYKSSLQGVLPLDPFGNIYPQMYRFSS